MAYASRYHALDSRFGHGFLLWLEAFTPDRADGRYEIEGDAVFALVQSYENRGPGS